MILSYHWIWKGPHAHQNTISHCNCILWSLWSHCNIENDKGASYLLNYHYHITISYYHMYHIKILSFYDHLKLIKGPDAPSGLGSNLAGPCWGWTTHWWDYLHIGDALFVIILIIMLIIILITNLGGTRWGWTSHRWDYLDICDHVDNHFITIW